jgi:hypothetical protein
MSSKNDRLEFPDALISELKARRECASVKRLGSKAAFRRISLRDFMQAEPFAAAG